MSGFRKSGHILQTCGHDKVVCIASTHGTNAFDFLLITLLMVVEFGEGYPVSWCLCN